MIYQEKLIKLIGTPFDYKIIQDVSDNELIELYDFAFENRVALLYLSKYRKEGWNKFLEKKYKDLKEREEKTFDVISRLASKLNDFDKDNYIVFKSIKPYPATPNDTDVIWLGSKEKYNIANEYLLNNGYIFHEWAPQQKTYFDERGKDQVGKGKKGGTYYIDFYEEISTDYYAYANKHKLRPYLVRKVLNGIEVNLLASEPELAIMMFHNVFPERTFQLEHFFVPLYYFKKRDFNLNVFVNFVISQKMEVAIKTNLTLIMELHKKYFGFIPSQILMLVKEFGTNTHERNIFIMNNYKLPHMFSQKTFWFTFIQKTKDFYSLKSLFVQGIKMLNPKFFIDVIGSIKKRMSEKGVYHLE